jgi:spore coat polysaccharide biosynthesis protein SpsF
VIAAIIQARMTSTRLPGKIMLKTCNKTFLHHMIDRVKHSKTLDKIVIATTINKTDDVIEIFCRENDIFCYRGSEEDLLDRYKMAADAVSADLVVRLTSDTPLMDPTVIDKIVNIYQNNQYDLVSNNLPLPRTYPDGMNVEVFSHKILNEIHKEAKKHSDREHVTFFLTMHPEKYKIHRVDYEIDISKYRFNLDYSEDYDFLKSVFEGMYHSNPLFTLEDIIEWLNEHPEILKLNKDIKPYLGILQSFQEDVNLGFDNSSKEFLG